MTNNRPIPWCTRSLNCRKLAANEAGQYSDKIYLPPSYLTMILDSTAAQGSHNTQSRFRDRSNGVRSSMNNNDSEYANRDIQSLSPFTFSLTARDKFNRETVAYCGVREFVYEEGYVGLPAWLMDELRIEEGSTVQVGFVRLEKGEFVRLQVLGSSQDSSGDLRALLEAHMRSSLTVLFEGETISVPVKGIAEPIQFSVAALEPPLAVDIVDIDLSVDIVQPAGELSSMSSSSRDSDRSAVLEQNKTLSISGIGKGETRRFDISAPSGASSSIISITAECMLGDISLFADSLNRTPDELNNTWADFSPPSTTAKRLLIDTSKLPDPSSSVYLSVVGFAPTSDITLSLSFADNTASAQETSTGDESKVPRHTDHSHDTDEPGSVACPNCHSWVPENRLDLHLAFCERNNYCCPKCKRVFKKGSAEAANHWHCDECDMQGDIGDKSKHEYFHHTVRDCPCQQEEHDPESLRFSSLAELIQHRRTSCADRLIECRYCHNIQRQGPRSFDPDDMMIGLHEHEGYCGNRTIACAKCNANVRIKKVAVHMRIHAANERAARDAMVPCANLECTRERASPPNPLGLCSVCFGQFWTSEHDPKNVKLLQRVARKLHSQLLHGCGKKYCRNPMCATSIANAQSGSGPLSPSEAAAKMIPVLKVLSELTAAPLSEHTSNRYLQAGLRLCVDETTSKARTKLDALK